MLRPAPGSLPRGGGVRGLGVREGGRAVRVGRGAWRRPSERRWGKWRLRALGGSGTRSKRTRAAGLRPDPEHLCPGARVASRRSL